MQKPAEIVCFDYDLWAYDIGYAAEPKEGDVLPFSWCISIIDQRVKEITDNLDCKKYYGYLTGKGNFRDEIAKADIYKGNRKQPKPYHYNSIRTYLQMQHHAVVVNGMEADDAIAIDMTTDSSVICVSRDKDLRQVPGWHYGYSVGKQPEYPLRCVDFIGDLELVTPKKLTGTGLLFFWSQVLTGDSTDNYKGLRKFGPVAAYQLLSELSDPDEMYDAVLQVYLDTHGDTGKEKFIEQCRLAWMVRKVNEDLSPVIITGERGFYYE
jgi:hypothetical protein